METFNGDFLALNGPLNYFNFQAIVTKCLKNFEITIYVFLPPGISWWTNDSNADEMTADNFSGGFTDNRTTAWFPVNPDHFATNVENQQNSSARVPSRPQLPTERPQELQGKRTARGHPRPKHNSPGKNPPPTQVQKNPPGSQLRERV
ncbi:hypothetical protein CEXT_248341 [Caerostris extrusa]|uniref:Uncharacterized protein n=1 Tax=Caerostris extrusa TaxID=172846 RepID=A0AAV4XKC7_CAEEX|nr:hypothetical protein CEXT_248341 [Caerostris extrusa]